MLPSASESTLVTLPLLASLADGPAAVGKAAPQTAPSAPSTTFRFATRGERPRRCGEGAAGEQRRRQPVQAMTTDGATPVYIAAATGHVDVVKALLVHNAN